MKYLARTSEARYIVLLRWRSIRVGVQVSKSLMPLRPFILVPPTVTLTMSRASDAPTATGGGK